MIYRGNYFIQNDEVHFCGNEFYDCVFDKCIIIYDGTGPLTIDNCRLVKPHFVFKGPAGDTLQFIKQINEIDTADNFAISVMSGLGLQQNYHNWLLRKTIWILVGVIIVTLLWTAW